MNTLRNSQFSKSYKNRQKARKFHKSEFMINTHIKQKRKRLDSVKLVTQYDALTELPNDVYFLKELNNALRQSESNNQRGAIICIDIDDYKIINDNWGYCSGNTTLKTFAKLINNCTGEDTTLVRLSGYEFAILVYEFHDIKEIESICNKIYEHLKKPFKIITDRFT